MLSKLRRAWPLARLIAHLGFSASVMVLGVSWMGGQHYFILGLTIGVVTLAAAIGVALLILLGSIVVLDDDRRFSCPPISLGAVPPAGTEGPGHVTSSPLGSPHAPGMRFRDVPRVTGEAR